MDYQQILELVKEVSKAGLTNFEYTEGNIRIAMSCPQPEEKIVVPASNIALQDAKPFSITVDCSKANPAPGSTAKMTFGSVFFGNSKGTLNNDMSINTPSDGVNIALHNIEGSTIKQVKINNPGDIYSKALDATSKSATYDFKASYVRADASLAATAGYVKTNTAYTVTYQ